MPDYVDVSRALDYVRENFTLSGEAIRMADSLLQAMNKAAVVMDPEKLMLLVLDGIGFDESDLERLKAAGIVRPGQYSPNPGPAPELNPKGDAPVKPERKYFKSMKPDPLGRLADDIRYNAECYDSSSFRATAVGAVMEETGMNKAQAEIIVSGAMERRSYWTETRDWGNLLEEVQWYIILTESVNRNADKK